MMPDEPAWDVLVRLDDTGELLWCGGHGQPAYWLLDEAICAWREAQARAHLAYERWCRQPGRDAYAVYRAVQDQADSAQRLLEDRTAAAIR